MEALASDYLERLGLYVPVHSQRHRTEEELINAALQTRGRVPAMLVLLDGRGRQFSSEGLAHWIGGERDGGRQRLIFAIGPADGWSEAARSRAGMLLSLGPMTLPHELARLVLVEQVYRAFTILEGHPYHSGH
jgi:23S rRNA (pseudouridine1915-N3)-methyltransferase